MEVRFYAGDAVVTTGQPAGKFVVEVLEPLADDAYFRWNFFDAVMDQKEWFSPYLFEPVALDMLQGNPELRLAWEQHVAEHPEVVESAWATLLWFYERSPYKEKTHRLYPVGRLVQ